MANLENSSPDESVEQVEVRRQKLGKLKEAGLPVYPNDFRPTVTTAEVLAKFGGLEDEELTRVPQELRLAVRIMGIRKFGKSSFFNFIDGL
jgi:lysyl-tRNA synthetase class 2